MRTRHAMAAMMKIGAQEIPTESINHSVNRKSRINNTLNTFFLKKSFNSDYFFEING